MIRAVPKMNSEWAKSERGRSIGVRRDPFLTPSSKIFAIGSCFAVEIRKALRQRGYRVLPDYPAMPFDPARQAPGLLPARDNINHYDTFVLRQEIARALARERWSEFWTRKRHRFVQLKGWTTVHQDPHRRDVYASDAQALKDLSDQLSATIDDGLADADVVIITLGLTECWRIRETGRYAALGPHDEKDETFPLLEFRATSFEENYINLEAMIGAILAAYPRKRIVLTVSPVALGRTWTGEDVVSANLHSKATLRAVVGELCRKRPELVYWPSLEYAMGRDVFQEDGRHVRPEVVESIIDAFLDAHGSGTIG